MKKRFPVLASALLLSALFVGTPGVSSGTDNAATLPAPASDNAAALPAGIDNAAAVPAAADNAAALEDAEPREPDFGGEPPPPARVADPIEPFNRAMFTFNDRFYYWVAKPVAKGYNRVLNEDIRISVRNFFSNLATPARAANNLLQGEIRATGTEVLRFVMNSTMGILGFFDVARDFGIEKVDTDLGLTLGKYGLGQGMYLVLPFMGPSSLRDGVGWFGDRFLDPVSYVDPWEASAGLSGYRAENNVSLRLGVYEELTEPALDPYIAVRDAYLQHRAKDVRQRPFRER